MSRDSHLNYILGNSLFERVAICRVLMVGAGGIGCELLKNLVLSGFKTIEVVDLDTIDLSNLNRQFLFQKQHIKKSKAHVCLITGLYLIMTKSNGMLTFRYLFIYNQVAKESALKFNPSVNITSHHANIKDPQFNVEWFKSFDIVMNALDNLVAKQRKLRSCRNARKYVNMMCLAADVPLIESGTTGYLGQAYVIKKGQTECFDCYPKPTPTTYPVCTIRSTPSTPIHCIVWAKSYLFSQLFGKSEEEEEEEALEKERTEENAKEIEALKQETEELKAIKAAAGTEDYSRKVFEKVFTTDITRLLSMEDVWNTRKPPIPLQFDELHSMMDVQASEGHGQVAGLKDQQLWTVKENFDVFQDSLKRLSERLAKDMSTDPEAVLSFDKDDNDTLDFVTATSNLRARVFGIQEKSRFEVKSMAGNIIPAIATTNAIIAGAVVMQAFKVLNGRLEDAKRTYLRYGTRAPQLLLYLEGNSKPNPKCYVCQNTNIDLKVDVHNATLRDLVEKMVCASEEDGGIELGEEVVVTESGRMLYDIEFEDNLDKTLADLGVVDGKMVSVTAEDDDGKEPVIFLIQHRPSTDLDGKLFALSGPVHIRTRTRTDPMETDKAQVEPPPMKRKAPSDGDGDPEVGSSKKRAVGSGPAPEKEIVIDEDEIVVTEDGERKEVFVILDDD
ncbi:hypothetical protein BC937DRAFT_86396 [Endogone sp. FLAS-F59071]|nr:hypothetical protein BC937DRAFT_86396 [Endogone sp. FLAS-F59071]|eukprot:RUS20081.1 hypothetical protein BC937DRAFT_86396 [Endogone sp. FLAS-F59071]